MNKGTVASFTQGGCYYIFKFAKELFHLKRIQVEPVRWKKYFDLIKHPKSDSIKKAKEYFPKLNWCGLRKASQEGLADAILIGIYSQRRWEVKNG
jgi:hypothetical protein